jgi:hypothetical protein
MNICIATFVRFLGVFFVFQEKLVSTIALCILILAGVVTFVLVRYGYVRGTATTPFIVA